MIRPIAALTVALTCLASAAWTAPPEWTAKTLHAFSVIPVQDGGRIKPLDTYASFLLLRLNGHRTCTTPEGERRAPMEFLLDSLFFPEQARTYKLFLVENGQALEVLGMHPEKRRDRYAYDQLAPYLDKLIEFGNKYAHVDAKERTATQSQLVNLANNVFEFQRITAYLRFATATVDVRGTSGLEDRFDDMSAVPVAEMLAAAPALAAALRSQNAASNDISRVLSAMEAPFQTATALAIIPPPNTSESMEAWLTPNDAVQFAFAPFVDASEQAAVVAQLGALVTQKSDPPAFETAATTLSTHIAAMATTRGEYAKVPLEVTFYRGKFFYYSLVMFIFCFILVSWTWIAPNSKRLWTVAMVALTLPTAYLIAGIVLRCIIRARPPVSTLYESILFITAVVVLLCLIIEFIGRERLALAIAPTFGALGVFLANKYETMEGVDTMPSLVAVLDTNFWLATHVTTVTIGYGAGLLAAGVAHIYLLGKLIGFRKGDKAFYAKVATVTYGVICFGLVFSVVGTVLGGIWANYSWGRFWGWDPKENGALLIVLAELAILHFRMGGHIRQHGLCMAAVANGIVVGFSWFGVNLLGIGLHSYGFTSGIARALMIFYAVEIAVLCLGAIAAYREQRPLKVQTPNEKAGAIPGRKAKAH